MRELKSLDRKLKNLSADVTRMQKPVDRLYLAVHGGKAVVAKPAQLSRSMKWLASKADSLRNTALLLVPFPVIGTLAGRIAKILRSVKSKADRAKRAADKLDRKIRPAKNALARLDPPVTKAKRSLDRAQALLQGWLAMTAELDRRFGAGASNVESVCGDINRVLAPELKAIAEKSKALRQSLNATSGGFEGVIKASKPVTDALAAAEDLVDVLRPLEGPLNELAKALRPVKWALDAASWVTSRVIDPIVDEILKAVGLKRLVDRLERRVNPLARLVAPLERAVNAMSNSVARLGNTSAMAASLNGIPGIEKRIIAAMKPLSGLAG
jgi:ABC-type transporter Mla subunit MlaD